MSYTPGHSGNQRLLDSEVFEKKETNPETKKDMSYTTGHSGNQRLLDSEVFDSPRISDRRIYSKWKL